MSAATTSSSRPILPILRRHLARGARGLALWAVAMLAVLTLYLSFYETVASPGMTQVMESLPPVLRLVAFVKGREYGGVGRFCRNPKTPAKQIPHALRVQLIVASAVIGVVALAVESGVGNLNGNPCKYFRICIARIDCQPHLVGVIERRQRKR